MAMTPTNGCRWRYSGELETAKRLFQKRFGKPCISVFSRDGAGSSIADPNVPKGCWDLSLEKHNE